uniref:Uncharacterized protein n=1 Tax=Homalodisca liturata TaxID=320908 RepID=A0A1B6HKG4_9HEMI
MFSIIEKIIIRMEKVPIILLLTLATLVMMSFEALFSKIMKKMLARIRFSPWNRNYFISAIWNLSFILVSSMIIIMMIDGSLTDLFLPIAGNIDLNEELVCCKTHQHKQHQIDVSGVTSGFVMHFGYFMSSTIYAIGEKSYKSLEFLRKQIIFAIILLTYYSKCPLYGLCILLLSHRSSLLQNATKLCVLVGHHTNSLKLAAFSLGIFVYYGAIWFVSFVIELPMFLSRNKTIESSMMFAELNLLIIIHGLVVMYVIISLLEGPCSRMIIAYISHAPDSEKNLKFYLFGANLAHRMTSSVSASNRRDMVRQKSRALIQVIKTTIVLKRKLREARDRMAVRRAIQEAAAVLEVPSQGTAHFQETPRRPKRLIKNKDRTSARQRTMGQPLLHRNEIASPTIIDLQTEQPETSQPIPPLVDSSEESLLAYQSQAQRQRRPLRKREETNLDQQSSLPRSTTEEGETDTVSLQSVLSRDTPQHSYMLRPRPGTSRMPSLRGKRSRLE